MLTISMTNLYNLLITFHVPTNNLDLSPAAADASVLPLTLTSLVFSLSLDDSKSCSTWASFSAN